MRHFSILIMLAALSACDTLAGSTGQDTSFERVGSLECAERASRPDAPVIGTEADPVRCGPQSQAIPR